MAQKLRAYAILTSIVEERNTLAQHRDRLPFPDTSFFKRLWAHVSRPRAVSRPTNIRVSYGLQEFHTTLESRIPLKDSLP